MMTEKRVGLNDLEGHRPDSRRGRRLMNAKRSTPKLFASVEILDLRDVPSAAGLHASPLPTASPQARVPRPCPARRCCTVPKALPLRPIRRLTSRTPLLPRESRHIRLDEFGGHRDADRQSDESDFATAFRDRRDDQLIRSHGPTSRRLWHADLPADPPDQPDPSDSVLKRVATQLARERRQRSNLPGRLSRTSKLGGRGRHVPVAGPVHCSRRWRV